MTRIYESDVEEMLIEILDSQGWVYLSPEEQEKERKDLSEVVLVDRLKHAIDFLNPDLPVAAREDALKQVLNLPSQNLIDNNEAFHKMLTDGVQVEYQYRGNVKGATVQLIDFENIGNNDLVVTNQFTVVGAGGQKRPDVVLLVNGLPLVVIELKNPTDEKATVRKAFTQLQNYKSAIPELFHYNGILVASDGHDAKAGSLTADWSRFLAWKRKEDREDEDLLPQAVVMAQELLNPKVLLDVIRHFTVFQKVKREHAETGATTIESVKIIAAYHQYHAVNKAVEASRQASREGGDRKIGVVWHTQGSGKSFSMVFFAGKVILTLDNPTIVVLTDRNDLDDQLFDTFAASQELLRQKPEQVQSRKDLQKILKTSGGGVYFTTIQKFSPEGNAQEHELLSNRSNIIVIADEAHRSQYGFSAKTTTKDEEAFTRYGFAKYLRDALPNASFIGFTGTPIEKEDASTRAVFGDYLDVYDIQQAVEDGATVRIFYESRLAKVRLKTEEKKLLDKAVEEITEGEESTASERAKTKWTQIEAIVGHPDRLRTVAEDFVEHFEKRQETFAGKAMIVTMSRRIAVDLFEQIVKLRPEWDDKDLARGAIKVVMTSSSSDDENWQRHHTTKDERRKLADRVRDVNDPLKIVIVRDMWLTGFDAPCVKTMYIDKPMKGHNLMQAIARVNRVYKDIEGGLIVDYIGIASDLKKALATYTESGGTGAPTLDIEDAVAIMLEKYEVVGQMFAGFDYAHFFTGTTQDKLQVILQAQEHVLSLEAGKDRFVKHVELLSKAYATCSAHPKAFAVRDDVGFFRAVKARLVKFEPAGTGKSDEEIETAIRQLVEQAVVSEGVMDVFDAAGIKKPDISILSDEFLSEIRDMKQKNLALELLKKVLMDEARARSQKNLVQGKKFSEMLEKAIARYQNNLLTAAEVIEELIRLAKEIKQEESRGEQLGLSEDEIAFYDALSTNDSAQKVLGHEKLRELARVLVDRVRSNTAIDWTIKESVQAKLRVVVKRTLNKYGYPPDQQKIATDFVMKQASLFADDWSREMV